MLPSFDCNIRSVSLGIWTCDRMPLAPCSGTCTCPCRDGCQSKRNCNHRHTRSCKQKKREIKWNPFSLGIFPNMSLEFWTQNFQSSKFGYETCWTWCFARSHCNFYCTDEKFEISWENCCTSGIFPVHGNVAFSVGICCIYQQGKSQGSSQDVFGISNRVSDFCKFKVHGQ